MAKAQKVVHYRNGKQALCGKPAKESTQALEEVTCKNCLNNSLVHEITELRYHQASAKEVSHKMMLAFTGSIGFLLGIAGSYITTYIL